MNKTPDSIQTTKAGTPDAQQQIFDLQLLKRIALLTASTRDRKQLINNTLQELRIFFTMTGGGIFQLPKPDSPLHLVATEKIDPALKKELQKIPSGSGFISQVIETGIPHNWIDLNNEQHLYCKMLLTAGWHSLLAVPLLAHDRLLGILFLYHCNPRQFSNSEIELINQCCHLLATAIDSSELVEKLEWQHRLTHANQCKLERSRKQLREHINRLEESNRMLEQGNQMKDRFLALASHELSTPLSWIMLATEMLENQLPKLSAENRILLKTIFKGGKRLNNLIDDLLEMARIEVHDIYLEQENIDLPLLLNELTQQYSEEALRSQLTLKVGSVPNHISPVGDYHYLRQALERILKNALKFTPPGGKIIMKASYKTADELRIQQARIEPFCPEFFSRTPLRDYLDICVIDSGIGIKKQDHLLIFDKFHGAGDISLHGKQRNAVQGPSAGLGLPLAKGMIEAHRGMIWLENAPETKTGSCFHILLPLYPATRA